MGAHEGAQTKTTSRVEVIGRLGARHQTRELPSGDVITTFTVIVDRVAGKAAGGERSGSRVDSIACVTGKARVRDAVEKWEPGTVVEIDGSLRRRFWRSPGGLGSAMDADVRAMRRVREST
jgi:single-strand DNA-binding protein